MIKRIAIAAAALLAVSLTTIFALAATKPDTFVVSRSTTIDAPPERVFELIEDFDRWPEWSPYEKLDPAMKKSYSGAEHGEGAVYAWEGNSQAGAGRITIDKAVAPANLQMTLEMSQPFECRNFVDFTLEPSADSTLVTWSMQGSNHLMSKVIQVFCDMDQMVGSQFEEGLANLKSASEK